MSLVNPHCACAKVHWTPVLSGLPDDELVVLVAFADGEVWPAFHDETGWRYVTADPIGNEDGLTHWMHLPAAPTS